MNESETTAVQCDACEQFNVDVVAEPSLCGWCGEVLNPDRVAVIDEDTPVTKAVPVHEAL
jgi:hypothetical protein